MGRLVYFSDLADGTTLEFTARRVPTYTDRMGCQRYRVEEPKVARLAKLADGSVLWNTGAGELHGYDAERGWIKITRTVTMKSNPSRHECDTRCMNASGRTMNCECACGGRNHGKGRFMCEGA